MTRIFNSKQHRKQAEEQILRDMKVIKKKLAQKKKEETVAKDQSMKERAMSVLSHYLKIKQSNTDSKLH